MFTCERCGSSYSGARGVGLENCPQCQLRDQVAAPLRFKLFEPLPDSAGDEAGKIFPAARGGSAEQSAA